VPCVCRFTCVSVCVVVEYFWSSSSSRLVHEAAGGFGLRISCKEALGLTRG